jgi:hypothetical protein
MSVLELVNKLIERSKGLQKKISPLSGGGWMGSQRSRRKYEKKERRLKKKGKRSTRQKDSRTEGGKKGVRKGKGQGQKDRRKEAHLGIFLLNRPA